MRPGLNAKRPRNNRNNARRGPTQGRPHTFDSNGPDVKIRGNPTQIFEKYQSLARDATTMGDRVMAESYFQHAEHYYRIVNGDGAGQPRPQTPHEPQREQSAASPGEAPQPAAEESTDSAPPDPANEPQPTLD